ncbi:hypothetical protein RCO48_22295 [Peribacillus frigoritolerans]|nr:hypothetical protein [Peribacillus frigoritolerans]
MSKAPIIFGLASIENAYDKPAKIVAVPAEDLEVVEPGLLLEAKSLMPKIHFDSMDVLIVNELGKDISGGWNGPEYYG